MNGNRSIRDAAVIPVLVVDDLLARAVATAEPESWGGISVTP